MKNFDLMSKEELKANLIRALTDNINLLEERKEVYHRIDVINARLDEAVSECLNLSDRLIKAKDEYRKLRAELAATRKGEFSV